jgi:menaquinone-dependent protoporphyrinogen oxidase
MTSKILITYATKYGSTKEVAEAIAGDLREKTFDVDVMPCKEVKSLVGYQAVVAGMPLYAGSLLSDGVKFLKHFQADLEKIPAALFVLGPLDGSPQEMRGVQVQLETNRKKFPTFKPASVKIFAGALNLEKLRFPDSLIKLYRPAKDNPMKSSDNRDWKAIKAWALSLPDDLNLKAN